MLRRSFQPFASDVLRKSGKARPPLPRLAKSAHLCMCGTGPRRSNSAVLTRDPIPPEQFYRNHTKPAPNPYAARDAEVQLAVQKAVAHARREWLQEQAQLHTTMVRKRLGTALQLPTLSTSMLRPSCEPDFRPPAIGENMPVSHLVARPRVQPPLTASVVGGVNCHTVHAWSAQQCLAHSAGSSAW